MPLTDKGEEIMSGMRKTYGPERGERVFYASKNAGTISGVDRADARIQTYMDSVRRGDAAAVENFHKGR